MAKGIKRTRAVSHKKKKITAVEVKVEISKRKSPPLSTSPVVSKKKRDDSTARPLNKKQRLGYVRGASHHQQARYGLSLEVVRGTVPYFKHSVICDVG